MKKVKILTVCGMGFGTSLMLLMKLQDIGKKNNIEVIGEAIDLGSLTGKDANFIFASEEIASEIRDDFIKVVTIKNILDENELKEKLLSLFK